MTGGSILKSKLFRVGVLYHYHAEGSPPGAFCKIPGKGNRGYLLSGAVSMYRDAGFAEPAPLTMEYEL